MNFPIGYKSSDGYNASVPTSSFSTDDIELAKGLYEQMKTDLESIKETLQNLVNAPAVPPVTEQFEATAIVDKKMSKAARIVSALHN